MEDDSEDLGATETSLTDTVQTLPADAESPDVNIESPDVNGQDDTLLLESPDRDSPDRDSPDRDSPDRDSPERGSPERDSPERDSPDRGSPDRGNLSAASSSARDSPPGRTSNMSKESKTVKRGTILSDAKRMKDALQGTNESIPDADQYGQFTRMKMTNALEATIQKVNIIKKRLKAAAFDTNGSGNVNWGKLFTKYDKDGSGEIDFDEFRFAIRRDAKITPELLNEEMLRAIFEHLDKANTGSINFDKEFLPWVEKVESEPPRKKKGVALPDDRQNVLADKARKRHLARLQGALQQTRDMIRMAKRGLRAASYSKGGVNWTKLFRQYDRDNSGNITFDEFRRALRKDAKITKAMLSDESVQMLFDFLDGDGGGEINFETEFLPWLEASEDDEDGMDEMFAQKQNSRKSRVGKSVVSMNSRSLNDSGGSMGSGSGRENTELSLQISQLSNLVKRQSKEIQRLSQSHSEELKKLRLEQDALCTLLDTSGTVPWQNLELEMQRHKPKPGEESPGAQNSLSVSTTPGTARSGTSSFRPPPRKLDLDEHEDLFEICLPLLQRRSRDKFKVPEVRWQFEFSLGWKDFPEAAFEKLEKANAKGEPKARIKIGRIPMIVYFDKMVLIDPSGAQKDKKVQRKETRTRIKRSYESSMHQLNDALQRGASPDIWRGPATPLYAAVESGNLELVDILLNAHATVNVRNEQGVSALHLAAFRGEMDLCISLLDHLADPNIPDKFGQTPIYFSPIRMVCELLFQRLADLTLLNSTGQSAFHLAAKTGYEDVLLWFALHLPRPIADLQDSEGCTAVDWARALGVNPHVLKKMHRWEPTASKIEWTPMAKTNTAANKDSDADSDGRPSDEALNQLRHKLRAAAHWRGGVDWRKLFDSYDRTGSGELTYVEFHDAIRDGAHVSETMMSDDALFKVFQVMDADDGGTLNYETEFLPWIEPHENEEESEAEQRIHVLDIQIIHEIKKRLKAAAFTNGIVSWKALFRYYDKDNSGEINFSEFKAAIRKSARIPQSMVSDDLVRNLFDYLDADGSGTVDYATEFLGWLQPDGEGEYEAELGRRKPDKRFIIERKEALKQAFEEHVAQTKRAIMSAVTDNGQVNLKKMWRIYDKKETGKLGLEDFKSIIRKNARVKPQTLTDGHVQTLFKSVDKNRDGWIDYSTEFLPWLGVAPGDDEPGGYSFSVSAAEKLRKKAARQLVVNKMGEIHDKLRTAAYDNGHANWKKLFRHYDRDDTGDMDFGEFSLLMRKRAKLTPQQFSDECLSELFEMVDKNGDGIIKYDTEFLPWLQVEEGMDEGPGSNAAGVRAAQRRKLKAAKKELNQNMNGILSKLKAAAYDNAKGGMNWEKVFRYYDKDGSGEVDFPEFLQIIRIKARVKPQDVSDQALKALFDYVDTDKGGTISYEDEFLPWLEPDED